MNDSNGYQLNTMGLGIASMVLGIISILFCCCPGFWTIALAVIGLVLGVISLCVSGKGRGMAIAGLSMCALCIVFYLLGITAIFVSVLP